MKKLFAAILFISISFGAFANANGEQVDEHGMKRTETVYLTGGMWMTPENFNPINAQVLPGVRGLVYESLFYWSPLTNEMEPWIAESFQWVDEGKAIEVIVRDGVTWADGTALTVEDVAFSFEYKAGTNPWGADSVEIVNANTVKVTWSNPMYHSIVMQLYTWPVLQKSFWGSYPGTIATEITVSPEESVGSGPFIVDSYYPDRVIYKRNENWWGKELKGEFPMKNIVYFKNMANNVVMGLIDKGVLDMANNFIPGVPQAKKKNPNLVTWYDEAPYHQPGNVVYLWPNLMMEPFDDVEFRRALAYAIDVNEVADIAFEDMVTPRYNSLGMHNTPAWEPYNNQDIADEYGFEFDADMAKQILADAGYLDSDGDGFVEYPDGAPMEVKLAVPAGWTDFMDAARIIADQLAAVGINCVPDFPDEGRYQTDMVNGDFELLLNNWNSYQSPSPYTMYQWLGSTYTPVGEPDWTGNFGRYDNPELRDLVGELGQTPYENVEEANEIAREIQTILLTDLPQIPMWVNSLWFVANDSVWTNWPSENSTNQNFPDLNIDKFQVGGLKMLMNLELRAPEAE